MNKNDLTDYFVDLSIMKELHVTNMSRVGFEPTTIPDLRSGLLCY